MIKKNYLISILGAMFLMATSISFAGEYSPYLQVGATQFLNL